MRVSEGATRATGVGMFFDNWESVVRTLAVGALAYAGLITLLRVSGKRTLAKMDAFDLVVTVALGSTLATVLLSRDVSLAEGLAGFVVLIALQFAVTWLSIRFGWVSRMVRAGPTLLYLRGRMRDDALTRQRVAESAVYQAVRATGLGGMEGVEAVVLETDGSFSVVRKGTGGSALADVPGAETGAASGCTPAPA